MCLVYVLNGAIYHARYVTNWPCKEEYTGLNSGMAFCNIPKY